MGLLTSYYLRDHGAKEAEIAPIQVVGRLVDGLSGSWSTALQFFSRDMKPITNEFWKSHFDHHECLAGCIDSVSADDFIDCEIEVTRLAFANWLFAVRVMGTESDLGLFDAVASNCGFIEVRPSNHERLLNAKEILSNSKAGSPLARAAFDFAIRQTR